MGLTHTVSGDVAHFRTPSRVPIESLKLHFLPKQEGSGDPSPTNVRPIIGWTGCNLKKCHKNIIKPYYSVVTVKNGLTITPTTNGIRISGTAESRTACFICTTDNIKLGVGDKVAFSLYVNGDISECENPFLGYYKSTGVWGGVIYSFSSSNNWNHTIWTVPDTYTDISYIDSYIYIPQGVMVNFEIGLQGIISSYYSDDYEPYSDEQIPITFPSNGKNRYHYDENNIELGLPTEAGLIRTVVHTGVYGNGGNISISATAIDPEMVSNNSFNVGYIKDGVIHVLKSFISWIDGSVTNGTVIVPSGYEFVIIATTDSKWAVTRNIPRYNIQIEYSDAPTSYEPYSSGNTFYGGYIDPVAGEIVAEYEILEGLWGDWPNLSDLGDGTELRYKKFANPVYGNGITNHYTDYCNVAKYVYSNENGHPHYYIVGSSYNCRVYLPSGYDTTQNVQVIGKLITPIHIPIAPQTMKAYLDHNNFWSDANDITEVSYEVTESKDIQAARKRFEAEEDGHHKLVRWNQLAPAINNDNWAAHTPSLTSVSFNDGVATLTTLETDSTTYKQALAFTSSVNYWVVGHKYCLMQDVYSDTGCQFVSVFGNGLGSYFYCHANEWVTGRAIKEVTSNSKFIFVGYPEVASSIQVGMVRKVKNVMLFDLTQMFGAGNEPTTVAEFERICALNGIDLTTYQPYDSGSDRWLIIP